MNSFEYNKTICLLLLLMNVEMHSPIANTKHINNVV